MKIRFAAIIVFSAVVFIATSFYLTYPKEKIGYVELNKLFNDFELKKELENKLTSVKQTRQNLLDSMEFGLRVLLKQIESEEKKDKEKIASFEIKREEYLQRKRETEEDNSAMLREYDKQIVAQLTQYVKDFGEKNGYTFIYGAEGSGTIMYADTTKDVTEQVKKYINTRYKGSVK